jgi:Circularly permutated YpsA SLOG family
MFRKIISGGQTGADRAGLDFAIEQGLEHGGYVPRGRKAEDGRAVRFLAPKGAAMRLDLAASTLDFRIKKLRIDS